MFTNHIISKMETLHLQSAESYVSYVYVYCVTVTSEIKVAGVDPTLRNRSGCI